MPNFGAIAQKMDKSIQLQYIEHVSKRAGAFKTVGHFRVYNRLLGL